jgi:hypothetical protein
MQLSKLLLGLMMKMKSDVTAKQFNCNKGYNLHTKLVPQVVRSMAISLKLLLRNPALQLDSASFLKRNVGNPLHAPLLSTWFCAPDVAVSVTGFCLGCWSNVHWPPGRPAPTVFVY